MSSELPPDYEKTTSTGAIAFSNQTDRLEQVIGTTPEYKPRPRVLLLNGEQFWVSCLLSFYVLLINILLCVGPTSPTLKLLCLMRFNHDGARYLVNKDPSYFSSILSTYTDVATTTSGVTVSETESAIQIANPAAQRGQSATRFHTATMTATLSTVSLTGAPNNKTTKQPATATRHTSSSSSSSLLSWYVTYEPKLYSASPSLDSSIYMGYFEGYENATYVDTDDLDIPDDLYVGIFSFGYTDDFFGYRHKDLGITRGIKYDKMVNQVGDRYVWILGLNTEEDKFPIPGRSKLNLIITLSKVLQVYAIGQLVSVIIFAGLAWSFLPRTWKPWVNPISWVFSLGYTIIFTVVARGYVTYIRKAFVLKEISISRGNLAVALSFSGLACQLLAAFAELVIYARRKV